ncbi:MAG: DUF4837 family protein [Luteibaculaceae bacterium]
MQSVKSSITGFIFLVTLFFGSACNQSKTDSDIYKPAFSGAPGELIIAVEKKYWEGSVGDSLRAVFKDFILTLPQPEYLFDVVHMSNLKLPEITKTHRNILIVDINSANSKYGVELKKDRWAKNQLIVTINADNEKEFYELFNANKEKLPLYFNYMDRERLMDKYRTLDESSVTREKVAEHLNVSVALPDKYSVKLIKKDFIWLNSHKMRTKGGQQHDVNQNIVIYSYPYTVDTAFSANSILAKRDSIGKRFIPGPKEGTYMGTEFFIPPIAIETSVNDQYGVEVRGLWKIIGHPMGGPFVSTTILDEKNNRIITVEGFIFAPKFDKREMLRELEAVCYSVKPI